MKRFISTAVYLIYAAALTMEALLRLFDSHFIISGLFAVLGIISVTMFRYIPKMTKWRRFFFFLFTGGWVAVFGNVYHALDTGADGSEIRTLVASAGFIIGSLLALLFYRFKRAIKNYRERNMGMLERIKNDTERNLVYSLER